MDAGVDEAGRGPLAGPVTAAAVILPFGHADIPALRGLDDSKKLSERKRLVLREAIFEHAVAWSIAHASVAEIDELNILQATMLAMRRAIAGLSFVPSRVLVDGNRCPGSWLSELAIVGGDATVAAISAASILAKTERDGVMVELDQKYPEYGFAKHKGYGTAAHLAALKTHGPSPSHRRSFAPVRAACGGLHFRGGSPARP